MESTEVDGWSFGWICAKFFLHFLRLNGDTLKCAGILLVFGWPFFSAALQNQSLLYMCRGGGRRRICTVCNCLFKCIIED
uniref:Ovule protein n=1 Tax=Syphacia muris TaxID=451379 RepID=A0A0N5AG10_9BILA